MKRRAMPVLMMALASGGLAAYLALGYVRQQSAPRAAATLPSRFLAVAARDLPLGTVVSKEDVKLVDWKGGDLPSGFIANPDEVIGRGVLLPVQANEPLLAGKLAGEGSGSGLPVIIPPGMRAVSVKVDEVIAVAGFVVPGTRVDVLVTYAPSSEESRTTTRMVLQNVQVIAAGQSIQPDNTGKPQTVSVITLLVGPEDAELLTLAANEGRIQLALRNSADGKVTETDGAWVGRLAGTDGPPPAPPAAARVTPVASSRPAPSRERAGHTIEIYNGSTRSVATF